MQRLFVGIELPDEARHALLKVRADYPGARWHPPEALHVTLSFIGMVDATTQAAMAQSLVGLPDPGVDLRIQGVGYFGTPDRPKVLWAGVELSGGLWQLQQEVEQRLLPLGLVAEQRPYRPHVTLARVKQGSGALQAFVQQYADLSLAPFNVGHVSLYCSRGGSAGVDYQVIERFSLLKR